MHSLFMVLLTCNASLRFTVTASRLLAFSRAALRDLWPYKYMMRIKEIIQEAPLQDYVPLGDFNKPGPFRGVDKRLIPHQTNQLKTVKFFEKTPYDFRLFFSHIRGTNKSGQEAGLVQPSAVTAKFSPEVAEQILAGHESAITVIFLGNYGDQAVMMTPWVMAHRIGHAVRRGRAWNEVENHFFTTVNNILADFYGKPGYKGVDNRARIEYSALFNALGTQRSSRENLISRPYEFMYEMFAQYIKTGQVTLNALPEHLGYGRKAWGKPTQALAVRPEYKEELSYAADTLGNDMTILFSDVLAECEGHIFFM